MLHSFSGGPDGGYPYAGLILDAAGNLYCSTDAGGAHNYGAVFEVPAGGTERVLYSFNGTGGDGADPLAGLVRDGAGNLYGTTASGGTSGFGTVFKLSAGGPKACSTAPRAARTVNIPRPVWSRTGWATSMAPPLPAALPALERCSRSMRKVTRLCCTISGAGRMVNTPPPVWCGTRRQPLRHHQLRRHFRRRNRFQNQPSRQGGRAA